jgi:hypothetical protein
MIRADEIDSIQEQFNIQGKAEEIWEAFRKDEPLLYSRMINHARNVVTDVQKGIQLPQDRILMIHNSVCAGYVLAFAILKQHRDYVFERAEVQDQFSAFLAGKLPDKFYTYDITGMDQESELVKAKTAWEKYCLQSIRRTILPILAEDVGDGHAPPEILRKVEGKISGGN